MHTSRIFNTLMMYLLPSGVRRTAWLKKHHVFGAMGRDVMLQDRKIPLYPELIFFGDNVRCASGVRFLTHDVAHNMLNRMQEYPISVTGGGYSPSSLSGDER